MHHIHFISRINWQYYKALWRILQELTLKLAFPRFVFDSSTVIFFCGIFFSKFYSDEFFQFSKNIFKWSDSKELLAKTLCKRRLRLHHINPSDALRFQKKSFRWRRQSNVYQSLKDFPLISKFDEEFCETDLIRILVQFINQCDNLVAWPNAVVHLSFHVICYPVFCKSKSNKQSPKHEY